jgi:nitroimidazol reductase NimA-like FMN-containing flavoprotein (pyridoxamine 5'-phosphate oxidase superfamily)
MSINPCRALVTAVVIMRVNMQTGSAHANRDGRVEGPEVSTEDFGPYRRHSRRTDRRCMETLAQSLTWDECLDRLRIGSIGRIAVTHRALPAIVPVNYVLSGSRVMFRTEPGGMLARACAGTVVAFEVDELDPEGRSGWSVLVVGQAELLDGSAALRAAEAGLVAAVGSGRDQFVAISIGQLSGRLIQPIIEPAGTPS